MSREKVVIIIPTYNEASVIVETVEAVFHATQKITDKDVHVLVFDSASTDDTQALVANLQQRYPQLHLQVETQKSGLGSAYLSAFRYALFDLEADCVFEFDADLSHQPRYLAPMLEQLKTCDSVVGSRYVAGGCIPHNWGWHRKLLSVLGNLVARVMLTPAYKDFTSGFRVTKRHALLRALPDRFISNHYAYKLQLLWLLHKQGSLVREYPIEFIDREKGVSKLPANSVIDSLRVVLRLRFYELQRYITMCLVGVSGMTVQFSLYNVCRHVLSPFYAAQIAVSMAIVNNFILNSRFTFKHRVHDSPIQKAKALGVFLAYSLSVIAVQSYGLSWGVHVFGAGALRENLFVLAGMVLGSLLNYAVYSRIVWRAPKQSTSDF
jgi:dolichol-phosphate mannosyltransferase